MSKPVDHVTMVDADLAGTAGTTPVPAVRHLPVRISTAELERPATATTSSGPARPVDRFTAGAGIVLAALGALIYTLSLDCGDEPGAALAVIIGTGGAALTMYAIVPGLTVLEPAGRAAFQVIRPLCWLATVLPRRAAIAVWLISVAGAALAIARSGGASC